jgi:DNA processing protein
MSTLPQETICATTPALDEERLAWLALVLAPGLGPKRILDAVKNLDSTSQIFTLPLTSLEGLRFPAEAARSSSSTAKRARQPKRSGRG